MQTERLTIRRVCKEDWKSMQKIWSDQNASPYMVYDTPHDTEDEAIKKRIEKWDYFSSSTEHLIFGVCLKNGTMIGFISCNLEKESYDIGYGFRKEYQGKGYAREALSTVIMYLSQMGANRVTAGTALANTPSVNLLNAMGFQLKGTEKISFHKDKNGNDIFFEGGLFELPL